MMKIELLENEMEFADKFISVIEQIVKTSSCSSIPTEFREGLLNLAIKYKWSNCKCNSAIYMATIRLYDNYIYTKELNKDGKNNKKKKSDSRTGKGVDPK